MAKSINLDVSVESEIIVDIPSNVLPNLNIMNDEEIDALIQKAHNDVLEGKTKTLEQVSADIHKKYNF